MVRRVNPVLILAIILLPIVGVLALIEWIELNGPPGPNDSYWRRVDDAYPGICEHTREDI